MLDSIRTRLTLWYTGVLALVLVVLFVITYLVFLRSVQGRMDTDLSELSKAFLATVRAELEDQTRSEEHTSELQSRLHLVCRLLLEKKKINYALFFRQPIAYLLY